MPLKRAIVLLRKIAVFETAGSEGPLTRPQLLKALDYASFHGAAIKTVSALRAYGLLEKNGDGLSISPTGRTILDPETPEAKLGALQRAALSPLAFRRIWRNARHATQEELKGLLLARNFTESGAERGSKIHLKNSKLAQLEELELEPILPERGRPGQTEKEQAVPGMNRRGKRCRPNPRGDVSNHLHLPLSTGKAIIPTGISADEFQLLLKTLRTWESKIVKEGAA